MPAPDRGLADPSIRSHGSQPPPVLQLVEQCIRHVGHAPIDENGVAPLLASFLKRVATMTGILHVSFDVDFLDPGIAPGVARL